MMHDWTKLLPYFIVEWLCKKHGKTYSILENGRTRYYTSPYRLVRFYEEEKE